MLYIVNYIKFRKLKHTSFLYWSWNINSYDQMTDVTGQVPIRSTKVEVISLCRINLGKVFIVLIFLTSQHNMYRLPFHSLWYSFMGQNSILFKLDQNDRLCITQSIHCSDSKSNNHLKIRTHLIFTQLLTKLVGWQTLGAST